MKRLVALVLAANLIGTSGIGGILNVNASGGQEITVLLNNKKIEFDVMPIIEGGRALVPARAIFEALGMELTYENGEISAEKEGLEINLSANSNVAYVNGEQSILDVPARVVDGRALVPLRFIGESTGLTVNYNSETMTATMDNAVVNDISAEGTVENNVVTLLPPKKNDLNSDWDNAEATQITLNGDSTSIQGPGAVASGGVVTISMEGAYVISGTSKNGQVIIEATNKDLVHLILNGVDITNETGAAIYAPQCDKLIITLADGTENTVTDGGSGYVYALADDKEPNAAIFSKDDLTINGTGSLTVNAGFNNGIGTKDDLLIISGNIAVNAVNHGLRGNDSVGIVNGSFDITAGSDGIQTSNETDEGKGWIIIQDGSFNIKAQNDGIQAASTLSIANGTFQVAAGGGSANAPVHVEEFPGGNRQNQATIIEAAENTPSMKGLKAIKQLSIAGGNFIIDAEDDGIHSNSNVLITAGKLSVKSGDDGIHADEAVIISGGEIDIPVSYEGIEGLSVTISGGDISIVASDDGINASDGESGGAAMMGGRQIMQGRWQDGQIVEMPEMPQNWQTGEMPEMPQDWQTGEMPEILQNWQQGRQQEQGIAQDRQQNAMQGGQMSEPKFAATDGAYIRISGGNIDILASTDGIDSNGDFYLEGGTVKISAQSTGAEGALEMDGNFMLTGGELITAGSVYSTASDSTQPILLISYTTQQTSGSIIAIKDSTGNTLLEYTSKMDFSTSGFTSPSFKIGETYSLLINGTKQTDITLDSLITSISDDGSAYSVSGNMRNRNDMGNMEFPNDRMRMVPVQP